MKAIIFTDLDASLLHEETFSCAEIIDVLKTLLADGVLLLLAVANMSAVW